MRPFLFAVVLVAGCTPLQWVRDGEVPDPEALRTDTAFCRQEAWREAQWRAFAYRPVGPIMARDPFGRRFVSPWPYAPFPFPAGDPFFDEARLADFCMRAKGYELVPVPKNPAG
jgi:hypothetical protein